MLRERDADIRTAGQPTVEQRRPVHHIGLKSVINLCPTGEWGGAEQTVAGMLGLHYTGMLIGAACALSEAQDLSTGVP